MPVMEHKRPTHSLDYTSVNWFGTRYTFASGQQSRAIKLLWEEWERGEFTLSEKTIGEVIGSSADDFQLRHVFRRNAAKDRGIMHPAWDTMIIRVGRNLYRLAGPAPKRGGARR